jgi:hypothetical protein
MNTAVSKGIAGATPAAHAIRKADDSISTWLTDLVTGSGSSPSQIIITGVLGVVPGVGQAMDARDLVIGVIAISKSPAMIGGWVELSITLIGCVPAVGDALKVGFKLMKQGHNFGRVLEAVSPSLRGNVEKFMRKIDWGMLGRESKGLFNKIIEAFVDGIDSWFIKAVAGGTHVKQIIAELKGIQKAAPKMIDAAFDELKRLHGKMMGHALPGNTAAVAATSSRATAHAAEEAAQAASKKAAATARAERKLIERKSHDVKTARAQTNATTTATKKKGQKKKQRWRSGIPAEHITDYFVKRKHINFKKANNGGKLIEEHSLPHNGMDHLWANKTNLVKPFVVGETKSSIFDSLALIAALPADLKEKFEALRESEADNPTPSGRPNTFDNADRDEHAGKRVPIGGTEQDDQNVRRGVNPAGKDKSGNPTGLAAQMSHEWIFTRIDAENLTVTGQELKSQLRRLRLSTGASASMNYPYKRWIALVTGRQLNKHRKSGGSDHEVQVIIDLPENLLKK